MENQECRGRGNGDVLLTLASAVGYEIYAWRLQLIPVVVMNLVFTVLVLIEIALKIKFDFLVGQPHQQMTGGQGTNPETD